MDNFYFENTQGNSNKFWAIELEDKSTPMTNEFILTRRWGQIGQEGRVMTEIYNSFGSADIRKRILITAKLAKGYEDVL